MEELMNRALAFMDDLKHMKSAGIEPDPEEMWGLLQQLEHIVLFGMPDGNVMDALHKLGAVVDTLDNAQESLRKLIMHVKGD